MDHTQRISRAVVTMGRYPVGKPNPLCREWTWRFVHICQLLLHPEHIKEEDGQRFEALADQIIRQAMGTYRAAPR